MGCNPRRVAAVRWNEMQVAKREVVDVASVEGTDAAIRSKIVGEVHARLMRKHLNRDAH